MRSDSMPARLLAIALCAGAVLIEGLVLTSGAPDATPHRAEAVFGVLAGTPHWRAYQNRLLGPQLVRGLQIVLGLDDVGSLTAFFWLAVIARTSAVFLLFKKLSGRFVAAAICAAGVSLLTTCCLSFWVYPWDYLDAIFVCGMLLGISRGFKWPAWLALVALGLWNRETALLLPLWLVIDAMPAGSRLDVRKLSAGSILLALGVAIVFWLRRTLFVHRLDAALDPLDTGHLAIANHLMLAQNAREFVNELGNLGRGPEGRARLIAACFVVGTAVAVLLARALTQQGKKALLWSFCAVLSVLTFGAISEARIWIGFVPLAVFWAAVLSGRVPAARLVRRERNGASRLRRGFGGQG